MSKARSKKPAGTAVEPGLEANDVLKHLHFNPAEGLIWLEDRRMVLFHVESLRALRQELVLCLGMEATRGLLTRFGYSAGCRDAELAMKIRPPGTPVERLMISGGYFHALQGIVSPPIIVSQKVDIEKGICDIEFFWKNSYDDQVHIESFGIDGSAACWMEVGYASGFLSTCVGRRILVREVECRATGADMCRCIARPADDWPDAELDLVYFEPRPFHLVPPEASERSRTIEISPRKEGASRFIENSSVIGASVAFNTVMHKIQRVAPTTATVLLLGESGVGKSAFAKEIRVLSARADKPFLEVNCAAIPEQLMEAELFGVERGAYTGAGEARSGRFQVADGGTLFLDEISSLPMTAQGKLLRVIQTGEFETLGSTVTRKVDVRILAATNENLWKAVSEGRFREDLFYRLNVFPIQIPPLRERRDDIPLLLEHLLRKYSERYGRRVTGVTAQAWQILLNYRWPGNVREFENVIERGVILGENDQPLGYHQLVTIDSEIGAHGPMALNELGLLTENANLYPESRSPEAGQEAEALKAWAEGIVARSNMSLDAIENTLVKAAFKAAQGNFTKAAALLGVTRAQLAYRIKKMEDSDMSLH
ncbi:sigma-54-dependent Fis family transcriptional regulator [Paraburkholderia lycopersici]|uniref:Regulatory protein, Fis family n=1 Tax=Paraburkholderia lycopersici TaxID=416944 RepID=A0A1G7CJL9_9BURK|nr:sigma-54-dependent Fis family transcriptional regulator [Paraburkholderia lycopersici]SDE38930.1 regulatory protein, Fis family [Paraburkholderia lycopersici]